MPAILEKPNRKEHPELSYGKSSGRFSFNYAAICALVLFLLLNAGLFRLENNKRSNNLWHGTGSIDLAVNEFKALPNKPSVVLLGSSLMMFPFWSMDKQRDAKGVGDIFHHHGSFELENEMRKAGFKNPNVFSFAIFGQMVSDAFIYVNEYLNKDRAPDYLIYGIAPRDFSDYDLSSPMSTNTFKRLINLDNFAPYASLYLPALQDKLEFVMNRTCFLYSHRWRLQKEFSKVVEKAYELTGIQAPLPKVDFTKAGFMMFGGYHERWKGSENEYARRYKNIGERDLSMQMGFLKRLLEVSRERGTKVVLVNMPLTEINRKLLPPGFYDRYRREIAAIAARPGVKFVDIGDSSDFTRWDFWDTAHLGPEGGHKVLAHLLPALRELQSEK